MLRHLQKGKENKDACEPSRSKRQKSSNKSGILGDNCVIWKKHQIKVEHKFPLLKKLLTLDAANKIKNAAEMTQDEELLLEITKVDLAAKEFKRHGKC